MYSALQDVGPNWLTNSVSSDPQRGQVAVSSSNKAKGSAELLLGGAIPYSCSFLLPSSVIQSVVHAGLSRFILVIGIGAFQFLDIDIRLNDLVHDELPGLCKSLVQVHCTYQRFQRVAKNMAAA